MKEDSIFTNVDFSRWTKAHTSLFASLAIGFFMWGVITIIAPLFYPSINSVWFLIIPVAAQLAGDLGLSFLSDKKLGRKGTFFMTMGLYGIGSFIIFLAAFVSQFYPNLLSINSIIFIGIVLLGIVLSNLGIQGEVPTALAYASESMPLRLREFMLVFLPNFDNIGAMFGALVGYITYSLSNSYLIELLILGTVAIVLVIIALVIRYFAPESVRWLTAIGRERKAEEEVRKFVAETNYKNVVHVRKNVSLLTRFVFLIIISVSQYLTYGLMAFTIADYYFSGATVALIVFVANLGASIAGFIAAFLVRHIGIRSLGLASYVGGTLTMVPILLLVIGLPSFSIITFFVLLIINMFFSEFAWAVRTVLEPVLMPTKSRAFYVGMVEMFPMISYAISLQLTKSFSEIQFVIYNLVLWALGAAGATLWFLKGYDTNLVPIEETSQENKNKMT